ncbi:hypothetical protein [Actinomyces sp. MRS3W]|uniref:hypothetical protein n=1 Tax=Actinomyces sp. MRS3W TaxID=2800796 RepID=UPI0028FD9154|nr:hypothetical protein [Actinomyces sp. MRS3W]MDU0349281.1 hypothetical protein [Actinomyces sp. MRS3W]
MNIIVLWTIIVVILLDSQSTLRWGTRRGNTEPEVVGAFIGAQGLPVSPALRQAVSERLVRRERTALAWGWGGLAVAVALGLGLTAADAEHMVPSVLVALTAAAYALGSVVGVTRRSQSLDLTAPRVARSLAVSWRSYAPRPERIAALAAIPAVVLAGMGALGVWAATPLRPRGGVLIPLVVIGGVLVGAGAVSALIHGAMVLADRPQRARVPLELAWDDALRSLAVRRLLGLAVGLSMVLSLFLLGTSATWLIAPEVRERGMTLTAVLGMAAFACGVLCWALVAVPWCYGRRVRNASASLWVGHDFSDDLNDDSGVVESRSEYENDAAALHAGDSGACGQTAQERSC